MRPVNLPIPATLAASAAAAFVLAFPLTAQQGGDQGAVPAEAAASRSVVPPKDLEPLPEDRRPGFESIEPEQCREWLTWLAADERRGREAGTPGYLDAAKFIAERFAECNLKPVGDGGTYFQQVPFERVGPDTEKSFLAIVTKDGDELLRVTPGNGLGGRIAESSDGAFEIVELRAKTAADVEAADLQGKAVLFTDESPAGRRGTEASAALRRAQAGVILTVDDRAAAAEVDRRISGAGGGNRIARAGSRFPNRYALSSAVAEQIRAALADNKGGVELKVHIEILREPLLAPNVVGLLEGRDPTLQHEIVGVGSHLDHIGARGEVVNNGADDDGSGTTGVLALAHAFAKNPIKPRRSILFMCFAGEEKGLVGSRFYVGNPIFPNEEMVAELQMDMIGRNEEFVDRSSGEVSERAEDNLNTLHLVGTEKLSQELHGICLDMNERHVGFEFEYDEEDVFGRSDHANFARNDIPIAFFFTGFHPQYHQPDDTVDRIDFGKLARVAQLVYAIAFEVAERDAPIVRDRRWADLPQQGRRGR